MLFAPHHLFQQVAHTSADLYTNWPSNSRACVLLRYAARFAVLLEIRPIAGS